MTHMRDVFWVLTGVVIAGIVSGCIYFTERRRINAEYHTRRDS